MTPLQWVRIRSWHVVRLTRSLTPITVCGRHATAEHRTSNVLPAGRSCESCLRIVARQGWDA